MVQHIVMWKLKEGMDKEKTLEQMKRIFEGFKNEVEGLLSLELFSGFDGADIILISKHIDKDALDGYQKAPGHLNAKEFVHKVIAERSFCDIEL